MKALICPSLGPAENLKVAEVDAGSRRGRGPGRGRLCRAQFFDTLIIEGKYQVRPPRLFARRRVLRPGRRARPGSARICGRRPGHGLFRLWSSGGTDRDPPAARQSP